MDEGDPWVRISNSKANCWRRCPNRYKYDYVLKLEPKKVDLPLRRGDWLHQLLMWHYDGRDWKKRHQELTDEFNKLFVEEREEYGDLPGETARIMKSYLQHYKDEDQAWRVVDSEVDEVVPLPSGDEFNFIIDLIVEMGDGLWLIDHKTVSQFMPEGFMLLDAQLARYFWAAEKLGMTTRGVMFNELITTAPTVPEQLKDGTLTKRQNLRCDVYTYHREIKRLGQDPSMYTDVLQRLKAQSEKWFRRTPLTKDKPVTKQMMRELVWTADEIRRAEETDRFPRTPRKDCTWDCSFLNLCQVELMGGEISDIVELGFKTKSKET
jgi:PD-(D/E)XK nuclease superfamily